MNIPLVNLVKQFDGIKKDIVKATKNVYSRGDYVLGEDVT